MFSREFELIDVICCNYCLFIIFLNLSNLIYLFQIYVILYFKSKDGSQVTVQKSMPPLS